MGQCTQLVSPPMSQCRKGHLYCSSCKTNNRIISCKICKQTFVEAPNLALERLVTMIGLPCKYGDRGCQEVVFLPSRLQHESLCRYRPIECQYHIHGCQAVFAYKDMPWHHSLCQYGKKNYTQESDLPSQEAVMASWIKEADLTPSKKTDLGPRQETGLVVGSQKCFKVPGVNRSSVGVEKECCGVVSDKETDIVTSQESYADPSKVRDSGPSQEDC